MHSYFPGLLAAGVMIALAGCGDAPPPLAANAYIAPIPGADAQRGRQLIADRGCTACHVAPGVKGPATRVGPPLHDVHSQAYIAGVLPATPENLVNWLLDPAAAKPRTAMPDVGLDRGDASDIAAWLLASREKGESQ